MSAYLKGHAFRGAREQYKVVEGDLVEQIGRRELSKPGVATNSIPKVADVLSTDSRVAPSRSVSDGISNQAVVPAQIQIEGRRETEGSLRFGKRVVIAADVPGTPIWMLSTQVS